VNNLASLPENFAARAIVVGSCIGGLVFVLKLWWRFQREDANPQRAHGTIPKILFAALFLGYATYSLVKGDAVIPTRVSSMHLRGMAALLFFITALCAAGFVTCDVLDRRATGENPRRYRWLMYIIGFLGWLFLGLSFAVSLPQQLRCFP